MSHERLPAPTRFTEPLWLQPYPDTLLEGIADRAPAPEARYDSSEAIALAFIAALQRLPPRRRAVLVLRDVVGFSAAEVADLLETTEASVGTLLRRARATLESRAPASGQVAPPPGSAAERELLSRFAEAFEKADVGGLVALLTDGALLTMPPLPLEYEGREAIGAFLANAFATHVGRRVRSVWTRANGQPAFGQYLADAQSPVYRSVGVVVLTLAGDRISRLTGFGDPVMRLFGLPRTLAE